MKSAQLPVRNKAPAAARFDVLATLIENYEAKVWPIEAPDPVEANPTLS